MQNSKGPEFQVITMRDFHARGKLSKSQGASLITLVPKKTGANRIKDFGLISPFGSMYKI